MPESKLNNTKEELLLFEDSGKERRRDMLFEGAFAKPDVIKSFYTLSNANTTSWLKLLISATKETSYNEENNSSYCH